LAARFFLSAGFSLILTGALQSTLAICITCPVVSRAKMAARSSTETSLTSMPKVEGAGGAGATLVSTSGTTAGMLNSAFISAESAIPIIVAGEGQKVDGEGKSEPVLRRRTLVTSESWIELSASMTSFGMSKSISMSSNMASVVTGPTRAPQVSVLVFVVWVLVLVVVLLFMIDAAVSM